MQHFVRATGYHLVRESVDTGKQANVFPHLQVVVQREFLTHITDMFLDFFLLGVDVETGHAPRARRGIRQAAQHAHGCGLACPFAPEETEDFALPHTKGNVIYSRERPEPFHQIVHLDGTFRPDSGRFALQPRRTQDVGKPFNMTAGVSIPLTAPP